MVGTVGPVVSRTAIAVVDASVAVKWLFVEELTAQARALLAREQRANRPLRAPSLLPNEVANAIHRRLRRGLITDVQADVAVAEAAVLLAGSVELVTPADLPWQAFAFAKALGLGAIYDALYVILSQRLGAELWTADRTLFNAVGRTAPWVRWIGDYAAS